MKTVPTDKKAGYRAPERVAAVALAKRMLADAPRKTVTHLPRGAVRQIAAATGLTPTQIQAIRNGTTYADVEPAPAEEANHD